MADREISALIQELPERLQEALNHITIVLEDLPNEVWLAEGIEPDQLGLFEGVGSEDPDHYQVPRIVLWLGNLWDICQGDVEAYLEEVRVTFLHELGHYLGLNEDDLVERDLG